MVPQRLRSSLRTSPRPFVATVTAFAHRLWDPVRGISPNVGRFHSEIPVLAVGDGFLELLHIRERQFLEPSPWVLNEPYQFRVQPDVVGDQDPDSFHDSVSNQRFFGLRVSFLVPVVQSSHNGKRSAWGGEPKEIGYGMGFGLEVEEIHSEFATEFRIFL